MTHKMFLLLTILVSIASIGTVQCCAIHPETVAPTGKIRGSILNSRLGRKIYAFRGVRYAEAPTGERRFQVATPAADWNGVFDASKEGPACPNVDRIATSEDCLRLNIYTTELPKSNRQVARPVLVFFHPGGFYAFSGRSSYFGPQYLMDKDIVLVTVNYRLGTLGFISTGDASAPGNLGLKDQVVALRWIQRNIAAFGGDPNSVTISGYSVGGLSTMLHMLSPMSKNLFHRAIVMSGSLLTTEPFPTEQKNFAKKQGELLNCPTNDNQALLSCLRSKPVDNFTNTMADFFDWHGDPIVSWKPVVEPEVPGVERFLPAQPIDLIRQGKFHQVPAIFGVTKDEFGGVVVAFENQTRSGNDYYRDMNDNWKRIAPISFMYERDTPRSEYISKELRQFYFHGQPINSANKDGLAHIYADSVIIFPMYRGAKLMAKYSREPVYFYEFTYQGRYSFSMWNATTPYGVVHHDDLQYLFFMEIFFPPLEKNAPEIPMIQMYTSMWTSFIKTGEPVPKSGAFKNIRWDRFVPEQDNYLEINLNPTMKTGLYLDRMQEWESLFPLPPHNDMDQVLVHPVDKGSSSLKMKNILIIFFCVICAVASQNATDEQPLVTAPIGKIRGSILTSRLGKKIYSFRGVRYGEPPTGHQRFQPPIPAQDWQDIFDASEEGPGCPRPNGKLISEDCLRLNVYTTKLPSEDETVSRPVMVFIHPGGFYGFSGQSSNFGPQYILDKDIVLVTINYRIGALGFLSTGDNLAPGNMGLKDQVEALRWVQRNIAAFGGDPNSVTLCGYSAGSFSTILHMVSPMSKDLFHRAITMSSSPIKSEVYNGVAFHGQKQLAKKQAELLGCPIDTTGSMMLCLLTKPIENFTDTQNSLFDWRGNPILLWKPTVEPEVRGIERFLTAHPYDLIKQGKYKQVPLIIGVTENEFGGVVSYYEKDARNNGTLYHELNDDWNTLAPIIFMYERNTSRSNYISRELRRFYFKNQPIDSTTSTQLSEAYSDGVNMFSIYRTAKLLAATSSQPVYFYKFTFQGRHSFYMWNDTTPFGVSHHDDLQYLFFMKNFFPYFESDAPEIPMVDLYTSMWTNFVATGEPIPKDDKFRGVTWTTFAPAQTNFLEINLHPTMKTSFFPERMRMWERLFPLSSGTHNTQH
ncbi:uncharacterized protein LOC143177296 [Calliopsis andreniformis]|uniref:uncharacterized protein LOC143177296 n=1 Tax=Calliopsis andreniformis TaxID=337506 RepID=UPI003FCDFD4A